MKTMYQKEVAQGNRFPFGVNWQAFISRLDDKRISDARMSIIDKCEVDNLSGKLFLDVGSGSGLFSLAARQLGAEVHSFDYDPHSVMATKQIKQRFFADDDSWKIEEGSALDKNYLDTLGKFDIVYSWGVLHHTGDMHKAVDLTSNLVKDDGIFFIAIYNDQGGASKRWLMIKQLYNKLPPLVKPLLVVLVATFYESKYAIVRLLNGKNPLPFKKWAKNNKERGMSVWHDWVDWCGGLPFEVAKPEKIIVPLRKKGFILQNITTRAGEFGCNEYIFKKATI